MGASDGERAQIAVAVLLAQTPDSGNAQAGGVSPPFTVCAYSWFEVWGGGLRVAAVALALLLAVIV